MDYPFTPGAPMTPEAISLLLKDEITDAIAFIDGTDWIAGERKQNLDFYRGEMTAYLPSAKNTSSVVDTVVADYIDMMLPDLIRPFTIGKVVGQYEAPEGYDDAVKIITEFVNNVVLRKDNQGELIIYNWFKDALIQKVGLVKVYWEEKSETKRRTFDGLGDLEMAMAVAQFGPDAIENYSATNGQAPYSATIAQKVNASVCRIDNLPPEEFIISRNARSQRDAVWRGHRKPERVGNLLADGYDPETVSMLPDWFPDSPYISSNDPRYQQRTNISKADPMMRQVVIHEGILKCDAEGKGIEEYYVVAGGDASGVKILKFEPYHCQVIFCDLCPKPMPHSFWGNCPADDLCPIQMVNTAIQRQALNNLYYSQTPQRVVVQEAIVFPDQLASMAPNQSIIVKAGFNNPVTPLTTPFMGRDGVEMMQFFDQRAEQRAGVSRASTGLDPDQLANQSATSAALAWSASVGRRDLIARLFAWGGVRDMFRGILKILIKYQDFERVVNMSGKTQQIDPRQWASLADIDVTVTTGLGSGHRDRDVAFLSQIYGVQKEMLMTMGPTEIVDFSMLAHTLQQGVEAAGLSNPENFFGSVPKGWAPQIAEKPDPAMAKVMADAQVKTQKVMVDAGVATKKHEIDAGVDVTLGIREQDIEAELKRREIAMKGAQTSPNIRKTSPQMN